MLAILHDDTDATLAESYRAFAGLDVAAWRCMTPNSQLPLRPAGQGGLPAGASVLGWNEHDEGQSWWDGWWQAVRAQRPDLTIQYGAPDVNGQWPLNLPLLAQIDIEDAHIGSTFGPPSPHGTKPVWVTEVDIDPSRFEVDGGPYPWGPPDQMAAAYGEMLVCMERCLQAGIPAFAWGIQSYAPDAAYDPTTVKAIATLNAKYATTQTQGGTNMASPSEQTQDQEIATNFAQVTDLVEALRRIRQGKWTGADGVDGMIVALQGGKPLDFSPSFP